jgi:hypothetical protein
MFFMIYPHTALHIPASIHQWVLKPKTKCRLCIMLTLILQKRKCPNKNLCGYGDGVQQSESLGLRTLSIVRNSNKLENIMFRKLDLFPSSGEEWESTLMCPSERANLDPFPLLLNEFGLLGFQSIKVCNTSLLRAQQFVYLLYVFMYIMCDTWILKGLLSVSPLLVNIRWQSQHYTVNTLHVIQTYIA